MKIGAGVKMLTLLLDIGTTTIKGSLLDKATGREISSDFILNEQVKFGEDVITRIDFSLKSPKNADKLKFAALKSINGLIKKLTKETPFKSSDIKEAIVVCNTAMHHLFLGLSAESLIRPPYKALEKAEMTIKAKEAGINILQDAPVIILPNIGSFVGSDAIGVIIASNIYDSDSIKLAIDIGTNGEIILGSSDKILVTSTAAGPAFEGRCISCGMPATAGAIEKVRIMKDGSVKSAVIGNISPKGICGSGLIDTVAEMLKRGLIDKTGKMKSQSFVLFKKGNIKIFITQSDVRKLQLAKAAIYAGIKVLMRQLTIEASNISRVLITGSFGNSINAKNAILTGLIPRISPSKVEFVKDAPIKGAKRYILSKKIQSELTSILSKVKRIPLARKDFQQTYVDSMGFKGHNT